jgi:hypothetical protein
MRKRAMVGTKGWVGKAQGKHWKTALISQASFPAITDIHQTVTEARNEDLVAAGRY